jgi:hypothetical protein
MKFWIQRKGNSPKRCINYLFKRFIKSNDGWFRLVWLACIHMAWYGQKENEKNNLGATRDIIEYSWISMC